MLVFHGLYPHKGDHSAINWIAFGGLGIRVVDMHIVLTTCPTALRTKSTPKRTPGGRFYCFSHFTGRNWGTGKFNNSLKVTWSQGSPVVSQVLESMLVLTALELLRCLVPGQEDGDPNCLASCQGSEQPPAVSFFLITKWGFPRSTFQMETFWNVGLE